MECLFDLPSTELPEEVYRADIISIKSLLNL